MFLRSLYGSRVPQTLHPRVDQEASDYWQDDTASAREMARIMAESEENDEAAGDNDEVKKSVALVALASEDHNNRRSSNALAAHLAALLNPGGVGFDDADGLRVEDMGSSPLNSELSPAGLISIAAADIDEASTNAAQQRRPLNGELDLEFIESLRRPRGTSDSNGDAESRRPSRNSILDEALTQLLGPLPPSSASTATGSEIKEADGQRKRSLLSVLRRHLEMLAPPSTLTDADETDEAAEGQSKLRFLSLLRRINELRSQQVATETWDGLPYPQILALPTFKYEVREKHEGDNAEPVDPHDPQLNNTMCAVCYTEYAPEEEVRALPCLHFYHRECIDQWLMHHRMCPICKHVVAVY